MYNRSRIGRYGGNWYQSVFWVLVGIMIGQFIRFDVVLQPRDAALPSLSQSKNS